MTSSDQEQIGSGIKLKDGKSYGDVLAPVYQVNDYSTEYLNRQTGANLTGDKLAQVSSVKMVHMILQKAGIIKLSRLMRIL